MPKPPKLTKADLREQLEAVLANYSGPVTHCPPGRRPQEDAEQREQRKFDRALRQTASAQCTSASRPRGGMTPLGAADGLAEALVAQRQFLRGRFSSVRQPAGSGVDCGPTE
jgi:hypothetical protein